MRRLQRAVASKEAMIKDLKSKVDAMTARLDSKDVDGIDPRDGNAMTAGGDTGGIDGSGPGPADVDLVSSMSLFELRSKLKESELGRSKARTRR